MILLFLGLNIYSDSRDIDVPFKVLDKQDFCIPKAGTISTEGFNPYTLDP